METLDLGPATRAMTDLIVGVRDDQLDAATPCPAYAVGDLVDHIGGLALAFTAAARKEDLPGSAAGPSGDAGRLEQGWRERISRDLTRLADAWRDPAAYDGTARAGGVEMPGPVAATVAMNEVVVHGWDLARATGQEFSVRDEDVATCFAFVEPMTLPGNEGLRNGLFGPEVPVPADASALDRLIGAAGRQP
ncbi:MAG: TIGR03086 family metal-binding protein [Nocardioides sp.]